MKLTPLGIEGAWLAESPIWSDDRGFFREWFKSETVKAETEFDFSIQQANISQSQKGVIRGLHYSVALAGQAKWITCVTGSLMDVIVDIRPNSPTYKKIEYINLTPTNGLSVFIGPGLSHGFETLEDSTSIAYLLTSNYSPDFEYGINPFDQDLSIKWRVSIEEAIASKKDLEAPSLQSVKDRNLLPTFRRIATSDNKFTNILDYE
jgi:dTDP-4-dehydrorhamnose 3,5-epimerase